MYMLLIEGKRTPLMLFDCVQINQEVEGETFISFSRDLDTLIFINHDNRDDKLLLGNVSKMRVIQLVELIAASHGFAACKINEKGKKMTFRFVSPF